MARGVQSAAAMNRVNFWHKRAHWAGVKWSNQLLAELGLTAARFDVLYALDNHGGTVEQSMLRQELGVARSTISVILRRLEDLGFVTLERRGRGRTSFVALTRKAVAALRAAIHDFLSVVQLAYETILAFTKAPYGAMLAVSHYADQVEDIARQLGDSAEHVYDDDADNLGDDDEPWDV